MVYDSAEQYGCQQHNSGRMDQVQRDASCATCDTTDTCRASGG